MSAREDPNERNSPVSGSSEAEIDRTDRQRLREIVEERHRRVQALEQALSLVEKELSGRRRVQVENSLHSTRGVEVTQIASDIDLGSPWWPAPNLPNEPLIPNPGYLCATTARSRLAVVAVSVFGREGGDLERVITLVSSQQHKTKNFAPVFLTDTSRHHPFHRHGYPFAYFPTRIYGSPEQALTSSKYRLLARKWGFVSYLDLRKGTLGIPGEQIGPSSSATGVPREADLPNQKVPAHFRLPRNETSPVDDFELIRSSGLFDEGWYCGQNPGVDRIGANPIQHYLEEGAGEGLDPSPLFQSLFYASQMAAARRRRDN
jgi:hypothetical protein